ncbi:MAG: tRNA (adenosine(37)-N6)-threonylcarbamoyltransferase complex dimerization subunit type 1 TsaB [Bacteroidales bacterium]|nr:tRNA (adenosine(37)-N6)-threonylcarbamoyltransferase complex dimerization subunit type 1 TsaB [Bacteroidales bacterium]
MPLILHIETATPVCSVALSSGDTVLAERVSERMNAHSEMLTPYIRDVMKEKGMEFKALDAVTVSCGPGSYTGLRIGVSAAKGLCYALNKPLIALGTLECLAAEALTTGLIPENEWDKSLLCPMIDARRMEVYSALYDCDGKEVREVRAEIIERDTFSGFLANTHLYFFGTGATKCRNLIAHPNAIFRGPEYPLAAFMAEAATGKFINKQFEDTACFEPFYLKDFIPGIPKVKGLS